jgi:Ca2+/Na+ antiporter
MQVLGGSDINSFLRVPFSVDITAADRPALVYQQPPQILATTMAQLGQTLKFSLSGGTFTWAFNNSFSATQAIKLEWMIIDSSLSRFEQPDSVLSLLEQQKAGLLTTPFVTLSMDMAKGILTVRFMPNSLFAPTAIETVTIRFTRKAVFEGVSFAPGGDTAEFSFKGVKGSLLGSGSSLVGSGAAGAAAAGGAVSMTSATQANKLQTIVNAFKCPNPDWRDQQDSTEWNEHPVPLSFGSKEELGVFAAMGFTNFLVIVGVALVHLFVSYLMYHWRLRRSFNDKSWSAARARVHYPSFLLFPVLFFFQTIVSSSVTTILYSPSLKLRMVGAFTLITVGFGVPAYTFITVGPSFKAEFVTWEKLAKEARRKNRAVRQRIITSGKTEEAAGGGNKDNAIQQETSAETKDNNNNSMSPTTKNPHNAEPSDADGSSGTNTLPRIGGESAAGQPKTAGLSVVDTIESDNSDGEDNGAMKKADVAPPSLFLMLLGAFKPTGFWRHPDDVYWINRYHMFFAEFREGFHWFLAVDITVTFVLGVLDGIQPVTQSQCFGRSTGYLVVFFLQLFTMAIFRPYNNGFGNFFFVTAYFLQFVSMLFVFIAIVKNDQKWGGVSVSINLLLLFSFFLLFKTLVDALQTLNDNFGLEDFFKPPVDKTITGIMAKEESRMEAVMQEEMTNQLLEVEQTRRLQQIQYAISGVPAYEGKSLLAMEEERVALKARHEQELRQRIADADLPQGPTNKTSRTTTTQQHPQQRAQEPRMLQGSDDSDDSNLDSSLNKSRDGRHPTAARDPNYNVRLKMNFNSGSLQYVTPEGKRAFHTALDKRFEPLLAQAIAKKEAEQREAAQRDAAAEDAR